MRLRKTAFILASILVVAGGLTSASIVAPKFSDAGKAALSQQLSTAVSRGDTPGVVALVVGRDGVLYEGAAGKLDVANDIAMPANAIFAIASMTKPVTSVAIMTLVEAGQDQPGRSRIEVSSRLRQPAGHHQVQ